MTNVEFPRAAVQPFVGRRAEIDALASLLTSAFDGRGSAVFVVGEPGVGKSRMVEEFTGLARHRGVCVTWATCREDGGGPAFWPWMQVIRSCLDQGCEGELDDALRDRVSDARALLEREPRAEQASGEQARRRLFDSMATLLTHSCTATPMMVMVDDLHWADAPSIEFLRFFIPEARHARLLLVGTFRDTDVDATSEPGASLWDAARTSTLVQVAGLSRDEVGTLLTATAGESASEELVDAVSVRSRGNPLFVGEFGRLLRTHSGIAPAELSVPEGIRTVIHHRVRRLSPSCRDLLTVAAVLGERFSGRVLARCVGRDWPDLLDVVDEAVRARVVVADDSGSLSFRFSHALIRDALYESAPLAQRLELHDRAANALQALGCDDDKAAAELATHALRSIGKGDVDRAVSACEHAGGLAMRRLAYERAAEYFGQAIDAAAQGEIGAGRRAELLVAHGDALLASNELPRARDRFVQAADVARSIGDPEALARAALGFAAGLGGFEVRMFDSAQIALLEEALDGLPVGDSGLRALLLARLSVAGSFVESMEQREQLARSAVAVARSANDQRALSHALAAQCDAVAGPDGVDERGAAAAEAVKIALRARDVAQELLARRLLVVADLERGDLSRAWREAEAFSRAAARLRQPLYALYGSVWRGCRALVEGRLDECLAVADETEDLAVRADSVNGRIQAWVARILVHAHTNDYSALHATWYPMVASTPDLGPSPTIVWRAVAALAGDSSVPKPTVDDVEALPKDGQWLGAMCWLARAAADLGDTELAAPLYQRLLPYERLVAVQGIGAGCHGSIAHWLGHLAMTSGRAGDAVPHLDTAVQTHRRAGMPLLLAHSLAALAALDGHDGDRAEAAALFRGMRLERLAPPPPTLTAGGASVPAFHRAGEIWTVRFAGRTVQLRDSKGVRDIAWLVGQPGRDIHVTELVTATEGTTTPVRETVRAGVSEPMLDDQAKGAYRARIAELEAEVDDADAANDLERAARARAELDFLLTELTSTTGLGGRTRAMTDDAERARKAVSWRLRDAVRKITRADADLGRHLTEHITTGVFCSYQPPRG